MELSSNSIPTTVDYWDDTNTWWDDFHHNYVDNNDEAAHGHIDGKFAIIVGLLGLDSQHGVHSELHPVYAMFVHVQDELYGVDKRTGWTPYPIRALATQHWYTLHPSIKR